MIYPYEDISFNVFFKLYFFSSGLLSWILLYLSEHQDVQRKLQVEIDNVLNQELPLMSYRKEYVTFIYLKLDIPIDLMK